jgi:magnesium chelatase family protein
LSPRARAAGAPHHHQSRAADLPKEGSHYDLPIALGLMAAIGAGAARCAGRLHRAGRARPRRLDRAVAGALPAAIGANSRAKD